MASFLLALLLAQTVAMQKKQVKMGQSIQEWNK